LNYSFFSHETKFSFDSKTGFGLLTDFKGV